MSSCAQSGSVWAQNKIQISVDFGKKELNSGIDWDSPVRHLVLLSEICVKIYRNIQIYLILDWRRGD